MSGAGRKHRAKHLTRQYLDVTGWVGPQDGETLAVCLESPQAQHVRVLLLLAHPETVAAAGTDAEGTAAAAQTATGTSSSSAEPPSPAPTEALAEKEALAFLPGKFHKVIWLSIKDIVVVADGTVTFKPSPEQIENFFKNPANEGWRERVAAAQQRAEDQRVAVQRMPQYGATAQTTTSVLTGPQVHRGGRANDADRDGASGDEDETEELVNPNWRNIKHHQQFFYGMDDDSDDEEEEGEEEEEAEEEEEKA